MRNKTRWVSRKTLVDEWGLPYGYDGEIEVPILATTDEGSGRWMSYHTVVFRAPDDGELYQVTYEEGLTEAQWASPWEDEDTVPLTAVYKFEELVMVTKWLPVQESDVDLVPAHVRPALELEEL